MAGVEDGDFDEATSFQFLLNTGVESKAISFHQQRNRHVPTSWILLDNQLTVNVFSNKALLTNIRATDCMMNIRCNAGVTRTNMIGHLPGYEGEVWYNPQWIANILVLSDVERYHQVTYNSKAEEAFFVHKADGDERCFKQSEKGLFYLDMAEKTGTVLVNMVADKKSSYTTREYNQAMKAQKVQNTISRPSLASLLHIVKKRLLKNYPVNREDVMAAEDVLGPNLGGLKGKTVRPGGTHMRSEHHRVPRSIMERHQDVTLYANIIFVNKIPFFITISRKIKFGTVKVLKNQKHTTILQAFKNVNALYKNRGFRLTMGHTDNEFQPMHGNLLNLGMELNIVSNDKHVPKIERYIRTV
jgi:hypothetical protein